MEDYQGNSKRVKKEEKAKAEKTVEKVITGEVIVKKKGVKSAFKNLFAEADLKTTTRGVITEVIVPGLLNIFVDSVSKGAERMAYGESRARRSPGTGSRVSYSNYSSPIHRPYPGPTPTRRPEPQARMHRHSRDDFIISSKQDAELILERMNDIVNDYEVVSVADLKELAGIASDHIDHKWGWIYIGDAQIRQTRDGWLLALPEPEPIK